MPQPLPFSATASTIAISSTAAASTPVALPGLGNSIRIVNEGPNAAFVAIAVASTNATVPTATAALTCTPVPVGDITLTIPWVTGQFISAICRATQTAALTVQVGEGV